MSSSTQGVKKGLWSAQEDSKLVAAISLHGVGRWNSLAQSAEDLQRSGKSCRLRWLNYLRPNVRRGGFTHEERLLILQLHFSWGNKWSKIAEQLPGRTDNDIKNYWRTRVLKHAKRLNCDVNSPVFKHAIHHNWIPALADWVKFGSGPSMPQLPVEEYSILEGSCSSSAASDSVVLVQAQKDGQMKVNGPEFGPLEIEPSPLETSDDQFLEKLLSDEDVFYLHNLLFNSTDSSS